MQNSSLKYGFYGRKSTNEREKQKHSLETQNEFKNKFKGQYSIVKEYLEAETATTVVGRKGFYELIGDIEKGEVNAIITQDIDRLARNFQEASMIQTLSQYDKIKVIVTE
jgi:DNA invertase Pin-like site-specific DNA recombinase